MNKKENIAIYWKNYWETVKSCTARPDGSAEIHYENGKVEFIKTRWHASEMKEIKINIDEN